MSEKLQDSDNVVSNLSNRDGPWGRCFRDTEVGIPALLWNAQNLIDFYEMLTEHYDELTYERIQEDHDPDAVLLGGVEGGEENEYQETSSAKLFRDLFGVKFKNQTQAFAKAREGMTVDEEVIVETTPFIESIRSIQEYAEKALIAANDQMEDWPQKKDTLRDPDPNWRTFSEDDFYSFVQDPSQLIQKLAEFIEQIQHIIPNYDWRARFVWELDHTPYFYIADRWTELKAPTHWRVDDADELWEELTDFLGIEPVFIPDVSGESKEDQRIRQHYTIYSYEQGSVGDSLIELFLTIWQAFDNEDILDGLHIALENVPNYADEYRTLVEDEYEEPQDNGLIDVVDATEQELQQAKEQIRDRKSRNLNTYPSIRKQTQAEYTIDELTLTEYTYHQWYCTTSGNTRTDSNTIETELDLLSVLKSLAPTLCVLHGLDYRLEIDSDSLEVHDST